MLKYDSELLERAEQKKNYPFKKKKGKIKILRKNYFTGTSPE